MQVLTNTQKYFRSQSISLEHSTLDALSSWFADHTLLLSLVALVSLMLLGVTILATPWLLAKLPANYWLRRTVRRRPLSVPRIIILTCRAILGGVLVLMGLIMMITPGPGLVMLLLGISVAEFPGKNQLLVYVATRPRVFASLNWMRAHQGQGPFIHPGNTQPGDQIVERVDP